SFCWAWLARFAGLRTARCTGLRMCPKSTKSGNRYPDRKRAKFKPQPELTLWGLLATFIQTAKVVDLWGISSAGRALEWHSRGQRFNPAILHSRKVLQTRRFVELTI